MVLKEKVLQLLVPVAMPDGSELTEVRVPRLKAGHLRRIGSDPTMGDILDILPDLCALPKSVVEEIDGADAVAIAEVVGDFLTPGAAAGKTRST